MSLLSRVEHAQNAKSQSSHGVFTRPSPTDTKRSVVFDTHVIEIKKRLQKALIARLGLSTITSMLATYDSARVKEELSVCAQDILLSDEFDDVLRDMHPSLIDSVCATIIGLGPIQDLLDDPSVTEIMINGTASLFYEKEGKLHQARSVFESSEQIMMIIDRILAPLGRRLDRSSPIVNARLENGDRVNAVFDSVAIGGPSVTIRKFSNRITSLARLVELGSIPSWYAWLLRMAVAARKDIAVAGGTGSGKTTLLNALSCEISKGERIVTIEDSAELKFSEHPDVVHLEAHDKSIEGTGEVTIRDLVKNALRMRPDRIVVGECRGAETIDMLQAMNTGHDGSLTTLHAGTAKEAILRLVLMARFGMDLPASIIEEQIASALDLLVMSERASDGRRYVTSLSEVKRKAEGGVELIECIAFDEIVKSWTFKTEPSFVRDLSSSHYATAQEVEAWRASCM